MNIISLLMSIYVMQIAISSMETVTKEPFINYVSILWVGRGVEVFLTLFRMGIFGAAHRWGGAKRPHSPFLKSVTHTAQ